MSIAILGGGAWGTALAYVLGEQGQALTIWARNPKRVSELSQQFSGYDRNTFATDDLGMACRADTILCVTPAQSFGGLSKQIAQSAPAEASIVLCAKGIDRASGRLLHELAVNDFGIERVAALSGPSFSFDVLNGLPTAVSLAGSSMERAQALVKTLARPRFRLYGTDDLIGVEIGGALKNVLALAVGATRGLNLGASAEAALIARGFAEINRLAVAIGARRETLSGLSGLGDVVLSCSSPQSRNFSYGVALARGEDLSDLPLAEGVYTASMALNLAKKHSVDVPIIEMMVRVLEKEIKALEAVSLLLSRPLTSE